MDVCVIGLGKLGCPLAAVLASKGHRVIGLDRDPAAVARLNAGVAGMAEPGLQERIDAVRAADPARLTATTDYDAAIPASDISFVIVPTPSDADGIFTNRFVLDAVARIGAALRGTDRYHVVNITSTVMPGSTGGPIRAALEAASGRTVGVDVGLTYNPEFIALGTVVRDLLRPDMLLMGVSDDRAGDLLEAVYRGTVESDPPVQRMNWVCAEITKLAVNTFVTTKISYANMLGEICERLPGADVDVVTRALGRDSRIGPKYLKGALGYGGPCFPRDNVALSRMAANLGVSADVAAATDAVNRRQADRVSVIALRLAAGGTVAVLGMAYKPLTPVVEESQGVLIAGALAAAGLTVWIADPLALDGAVAALGGAVQAGTAAAAIAAADLVVIASPDPTYAALPASAFAGRTVLDCWRLLPEDTPGLVVLGRG